MRIIPYTSFWLCLSLIFVAASITAYSAYGLRLSADFVEGSLYEIRFSEQTASEPDEELKPPSEEEEELEQGSGVSQASLRESLDSFTAPEGEEAVGNVEIKASNTGSYILRMRQLDETNETAFLQHIREDLGEYDLVQARNVSPTFARTFRDRAITALLVSTLAIILYITFAFRKVSRGIKSWKLGFAAIAALVHDIIIIVGIFAILGNFYNVEVDALFITALLSVMGFSVNDTIVVFDRVRENLFTRERGQSFNEVADISLNQTLARSINTSFSTLIVLGSLLILGASELYYFVFALLLGVVIGTYSSIFLATPLLTVMRAKSD